MALDPPGGRHDPPGRPSPRLDVDSGTWRWVSEWADGKRKDAVSALVKATTVTSEVHYWRGVMAALRELQELGAARGTRDGR